MTLPSGALEFPGGLLEFPSYRYSSPARRWGSPARHWSSPPSVWGTPMTRRNYLIYSWLKQLPAGQSMQGLNFTFLAFVFFILLDAKLVAPL